MKHLFVINVHSFVDLITNSSSELFVCSGKKSIESVKEIITELAHLHNKIGGDTEKISMDTLFCGIFSEPKLAEYTHHYYLYPFELKQEYEKYHYSPKRPVYSSYDQDENFENSEEYLFLKEQERKLEKELKINEQGLSATESRKRWDAFNKKKRIIWKEWNIKSTKSTFELFKCFLKINGVSEDQIKKLKVKFEEDGYYGFFKVPKKYQKMYDEFHHCLSWGIEQTKGDVLLQSASDNSIPYYMFGPIRSYLNAEGWHLG